MITPLYHSASFPGAPPPPLFVLLHDEQIQILHPSNSLARSVNTTADLAETVLCKEEGVGWFLFIFLQRVIPRAGKGAVTWEECHTGWAGCISLFFRLYGRWQEGTFNECYLSDISEMSRQVRRPRRFPPRCDVRFRISPGRRRKSPIVARLA